MTEAVRLDCVIEGGGVLGAFADGCMDALLPHVEIATLSGTSAGMTTSLRILWAQARAKYNTRQTSGADFRRTTARYFDTATTKMWDNACKAAMFAESIQAMTAWMPKSLGDQAKLGLWQAQSNATRMVGNSGNTYLSLLQHSLPCIEEDLTATDLARLVSNCVDMETGAEILTQNRTLDGKQQPANLAMHAASGIVPPFFPAIDGVFIDGAFCRNGPVRGAIAEHSDTPLLRIALGKPDFKAYQALYQHHSDLRTRAGEAFKSVSEPLPTDRPTAEICYPHVTGERGCIQLPTREDVQRLRAQGRAAMQQEIESGLIERLQPARKPLALAA